MREIELMIQIATLFPFGLLFDGKSLKYTYFIHH